MGKNRKKSQFMPWVDKWAMIICYRHPPSHAVILAIMVKISIIGIPVAVLVILIDALFGEN